MPIDLHNYETFCNALTNIDFFGKEERLLPRLYSPAELTTVISYNAAFVPLAYRRGYAAALIDVLPSLLARLQEASPAQAISALEPYCAPIYQLAPSSTYMDVRKELQRFLAVVSNLYRSFLDKKKRGSIDVPLSTEQPPLAFFQSNGDAGPYTITCEQMVRSIGTPISIVSLPHSYREHPIIWASLAHEVCGHDVAHADPELVPELVAGVRSLFNTTDFPRTTSPKGDALNAMIWSYWIDEAVADVYGLLNMGPTFPLNLSAFLSAFIYRSYAGTGQTPPPPTSLRTSSGPSDSDRGDMDEHPTDILRLHLAIGVVESLLRLSQAAKQQYSADIAKVAELAANGATHVDLSGHVQISHSDWRQIDVRVPLSDAADAARRVGAFIATAKLGALRNKSIQDIETWDDSDESTAANIADRIQQNQSIVGAGDDAQLLAGSTIAMLSQPGLYEAATGLLEHALDDSYNSDPIYGLLSLDRMFAPGSFAGARAQRPAQKPGRAPRKTRSSKAAKPRRSGRN